jgi:hypothetical protein
VAPTLEEVIRKSREPEGESLEFKIQINLESESEKEEFAKDVSAFANTRGGTIIVGIRDSPRKTEGLPQPLEAERIMDSVSQRIYPSVLFYTHSLPWQQRYIGVISIPQGKFVHELLRSGVVYVRRDRISKRASVAEIFRLKSEREHVSRTLLWEPSLPAKVDNQIVLFGEGTSDYLIGRKTGGLHALAECPVFLPTFTRHVSAPQFGEEHASILTEYFSHFTIRDKEFLSRAGEAQTLLNRLGAYLDVDDTFYWSISGEGSFAFGCGVDTLAKALGDGVLGVITLATCGEFRGAFNDRSFLLLLAGYCKSREEAVTWVQNPEAALYMGFIPISSDWIQTLLQPFLDEDSPFSTLSYELARPQQRMWIPRDGNDSEIPIRGVARKYKFESADRWTHVESVVADTDWYSEEGFSLEVDWDEGLDFPNRRNQIPRQARMSTEDCPLSDLDRCLVSVTNPPPDLEDLQSGKVKLFLPPFIKSFEVGMGGHSVYVIGVNGAPSGDI